METVDLKVKPDFDVVIVGGGLAGLVSAIILSKAKVNVLLIEKKSYPFHKVCGEYISNEVLPFLISLGFDPFSFGASKISKLRVSSPQGKNYYMNLDTGGFGISRYCMDEQLSKIAIVNGAQVMTGTVTDIRFNSDHFEVDTKSGKFTSAFVFGCYGKRDTLDKKLKRNFIRRHTRYMAVKYHIITDYPADEIGLDNFKNGYCGISRIEDGKYNLCYLYRRTSNDKNKSVEEIERNILFNNPVLKSLFSGAKFLFDEPKVINEISFSRKKIIEKHIFMCGDSAGLITPLCGNGMSMAISGARLLSNMLLEIGDLKNVTKQMRFELENNYIIQWHQQFSFRLKTGRILQELFGKPEITGIALAGIHAIPAFENWLIAHTHGKELVV